MIFTIENRPSDSPFVEAIYHTRSLGGGSFISTAASQWEMVVTKQKGKSVISLRGPETKASPAPIPEDAEFLGIIFKHDTFMPHLPATKLVDEEIHIDGSSVLLHALIENDLVDEYALHVYPLVLGIGKCLFPDGKRLNLKLIESSALPTGVLYQRYRPA